MASERPSRPRSLFFPLLILVFFAGIAVERLGWFPGSGPYVPAHLGHTFDPFWESWRWVEKDYVDRSAVQPKRMTRGAIQGMLDTLGDKGHTAYLGPEDVEQLKMTLHGNLEGIGARMAMRKQLPTVVQTMPGSPARRAGLRPGDIILQVNGKSVTGLALSRVAELVRGPAGTAVDLQVARAGKSKVLSFHITRGKVDVSFVSWRMLPGTTFAHVAIQEFGKHAGDQLKTALEDASRQGARGLIVDVRANPGGLKEEAVAVTSEFLQGGVVFIEQDSEGHRKEIPVKPGGPVTDLPLVLLIDEGSASSSEIFAGAIQDHGRGKLVGSTTVGTGTVLREYPLSDGSALLLAVTQWLTPRGRQIWHKGIEPDVPVSVPAGTSLLFPYDEADLTANALAKSGDRQLLRAMQLLRQQLEPGGQKETERQGDKK